MFMIQCSNEKAQITLVFAAFKTCKEKGCIIIIVINSCRRYIAKFCMSLWLKIINGKIQFLKDVVLKVVYYYPYEILIIELKLTAKLSIMLLHFLGVHLFGVLKVAIS